MTSRAEQSATSATAHSSTSRSSGLSPGSAQAASKLHCSAAYRASFAMMLLLQYSWCGCAGLLDGGRPNGHLQSWTQRVVTFQDQALLSMLLL